MWRFLNNISRAFKSHVHSPRPSAGLYVEEEQEALEHNEKAGCPFLQRRQSSLDGDERQGCKVLMSLFVNKRNNRTSNRETTCRIKHSHNVISSKEHRDEHRWSCHHSFWRMFQGSNRVLEALSWGSAMLLGTDAEKRRHKSRLLLRVLLTTPGNNSTIRQIRSSADDNVATFQVQESWNKADSKIDGGIAQDAAGNNLEAETLDSALEEFQSMCTEYTARTESLLGIDAAVHGDFSSAVEHLRSSCALGNMSACFNLGLCYETGSGVLQDLDKAKHYYKLAAMEGHSMALYNLGLLNLQCIHKHHAKTDCDCGCNRVDGLSLMEKAAKLGLAEAQTYLGIHHIEEMHDVDTAVPYFKSAAEQNNMDAQYFLAICYEQGWGVEVNESLAAQLYSQATQAGHEMAMYNLGVFSEHGLGGVVQDRSAALKLYHKSADLGCEQARERLEDIKASETATKDCNMKIETFRQLYQQHHRDDDVPVRHQDSISLSPSASSPNLTDNFHRDRSPFFGNHSDNIPKNKQYSLKFEPPGVTRRESHLGSDGDYDDDSTSPHSLASGFDESFDSSDEMFPLFGGLHKSQSQPNFSMVACNI